MAFWDKVRNDVQKSLKQGIDAIRLKAEELSEEGKRKYLLYELRNRVQKDMAELGGCVYDLSEKGGNPLEDARASAIIGRLRKLQAQMEDLEGAPLKKAAPKKTARKKTAAKKTAGRKTAGKKTAGKKSAPNA